MIYMSFQSLKELIPSGGSSASETLDCRSESRENSSLESVTRDTPDWDHIFRGADGEMNDVRLAR